MADAHECGAALHGTPPPTPQAEAERRLIWAALQEPRNQRFVLVRRVAAPDRGCRRGSCVCSHVHFCLPLLLLVLGAPIICFAC